MMKTVFNILVKEPILVPIGQKTSLALPSLVSSLSCLICSWNRLMRCKYWQQTAAPELPGYWHGIVGCWVPFSTGSQGRVAVPSHSKQLGFLRVGIKLWWELKKPWQPDSVVMFCSVSMGTGWAGWLEAHMQERQEEGVGLRMQRLIGVTQAGLLYNLQPSQIVPGHWSGNARRRCSQILFRKAKLLPNSVSVSLPAPLVCLHAFFRMVHELGDQWNNCKACSTSAI